MQTNELPFDPSISAKKCLQKILLLSRFHRFDMIYYYYHCCALFIHGVGWFKKKL